MLNFQNIEKVILLFDKGKERTLGGEKTNKRRRHEKIGTITSRCFGEERETETRFTLEQIFPNP